MGKLNSQEPYCGHDKVRTADGSGMPITHVGQASLLSSTSRHLHLCNFLCVPRVTRNLLSVRKFTYDNDVFCEFHPFHLLIKDRVTREVLLRGESTRAYMRWRHRRSRRSSVVCVCRLLIGMRTLVILRLL
jgi:hypothetical protein